MSNDLTETLIQDTYPRLVQIIDDVLYDGLGNLLTISSITLPLRISEAANLIQTQNIYAKYILKQQL
jgi:hypothetical protein